ncbi:MAG: DUF429 domain-containing protein [Anaerolineae bacterium]
MYWGIDGCKGGWIALGFDQADGYQVAYCEQLSTFWAQYGAQAQRVLIDMPIGLADDIDGRLADEQARQVLGARRSSIFSVPTREAIAYGRTHAFNREAYREACAINRQVEGKAFSLQSWYICPKIDELDQLLVGDASRAQIMLESHPEVLFWALNGGESMRYSKKSGLGFMERVRVLERLYPGAFALISTVFDAHQSVLVDDDVVDALVCALVARAGELVAIPTHPKRDRYGLPMQIVHPPFT